MSVTVYTKPGCVQCTATYRALDKAGIDYEIIDLTTDDAALAHSKDLGYFAAPIVITATDHWSGFRPDKIAALAKADAAASNVA
ncbi:glutaredoxin-like protein NrdH [Naumannella cuiyingiana]|uniref:Glutaredoxin-like protein NrdH n=1 Tax=Naumannella cuiyingiana TaxID=1347891 RepID=A0A7Z0DA90_9ACTN|nr:glutaredoxin-like protein NrdH [Naumannella cuiyingiana]NYI71837.1 glutaredoxin-like protein NrdH [Naumannella cuiyingiana]